MIPSENTPLLASDAPRPKPTRTVTFNANPVSKTIEPEPAEPRRLRSSHGQHVSSSLGSLATGSGMGAPPMFTALNSKLRRRNSHSSVPMSLPSPPPPKIGPQRSTKNAQKLKLLPNPEVGDEGPDEESGRDVYSQYTRIKDPTARRDAARLGKADRNRLPRVTAYCTANKYQMEGLMRFLKGRGKSRNAYPKLIDECIYTPYDYGKGPDAEREEHRSRPDPVQAYERRYSTGSELTDGGFDRNSLLDLQSDQHDSGYADDFQQDGRRDLHDGMNEESIAPDNLDWDTQVHTPEVFLFDYGVVVIWGMSLAHEQRFLKELSRFETEKLAPDDVEIEHFNFYYTREYQARIYNDFITLRDKHNYMTKLAISHALAQSVKVLNFFYPPI
jgi:uncharacterized Rmd1/YagE family protein